MPITTILTGHVGHDPELRFTTNGTPVLNLNIANNYSQKAPNGERESKVDWYKTTFFGQQAETLGKHVKKGSYLQITGEQRIENYINREGQERTSVVIIGNAFSFLGGSPKRTQSAEAAGGNAGTSAAPKNSVADEGIPF